MTEQLADADTQWWAEKSAAALAAGSSAADLPGADRTADGVASRCPRRNWGQGHEPRR